MTAPSEEPPLEAMIHALAETVGKRERVLLGELVDALGTHGFGPVILFASAMMMLPTGIIPGVPAFMGLLMVMAGGQILRGRRTLWLPPRIYGIQLPGPTLLRGLDKARPLAIRLGRSVRARMLFLVDGWLSLWAMAIIIILTSLLIIVIGAIPGLPFLLGMHILAFGLGLTVGDGLFIAVGYGIFLPAALLAGRLTGLI